MVYPRMITPTEELSPHRALTICQFLIQEAIENPGRGDCQEWIDELKAALEIVADIKGEFDRPKGDYLLAKTMTGNLGLVLIGRGERAA